MCEPASRDGHEVADRKFSMELRAACVKTAVRAATGASGHLRAGDEGGHLAGGDRLHSGRTAASKVTRRLSLYGQYSSAEVRYPELFRPP